VGNPISQSDREFIWTQLAEFFTSADVEHYPDFPRLAQFSIAELKEIFFREVVPACGHNLLVTTPTLAEGFDPEWVKTAVKRVLARRDSGPVWTPRACHEGVQHAPINRQLRHFYLAQRGCG